MNNIKKFAGFIAVGAMAYGLYYPTEVNIDNIAGYHIEKNLYTDTYTVTNNKATLKIDGDTSFTVHHQGKTHYNGKDVDASIASMMYAARVVDDFNKEGAPHVKISVPALPIESIEKTSDNNIQVAQLPSELRERIKTIQEKEQSKRNKKHII